MRASPPKYFTTTYVPVSSSVNRRWSKPWAQFAELTFQARQSLMEGDAKRFGCLMDANFDLRQSICRLPSAHVEMVEVARHAGATAQFAGSGGAIVGTYTDEAQFTRVAADLRAIGCHVLRPIVDADVERVA